MLIGKLDEIERGLGKLDLNSLRMLVSEAQDFALLLQRDTMEQHRRDSRHTYTNWSWQN